MQSRVDLYKTVNGHSIGRDLNRLRDMIRDEPLPFLNSVDKRAALALLFIEPQ